MLIHDRFIIRFIIIFYCYILVVIKLFIFQRTHFNIAFLFLTTNLYISILFFSLNFLTKRFLSFPNLFLFLF